MRKRMPEESEYDRKIRLKKEERESGFLKSVTLDIKKEPEVVLKEEVKPKVIVKKVHSKKGHSYGK